MNIFDGECEFTNTDWVLVHGDFIHSNYSNNCSWRAENHGIPHSGSNMIGLWTFDEDNEEFSEFGYSKLTQTLQIGRTYYVEFYLAASYQSAFAMNSIGALFSQDRFITDYKQFGELGNTVTPQIISSKVISKNREWTKISGAFVADKEYKYITIGNFYFHDRIETVELKDTMGFELWGGAYYLIDDITVELANNTFSQKLKESKTLELTDLLFDSGSDKIKSDSSFVIEKLIKVMHSDNALKISIIGHTDNTGENAFNELLSLKRAQMVKKRLVDVGIDGKRISVIGKGSKFPLSTNQTEEGRALNRRVIIEVKD